MTNQMLNIVAVLEDGKLALTQDRKTLNLEYSENTIGILKQYLEQAYQHDFGKVPHFRMFTSTIYNISNHIRETFYFHPSHSPFNSIEIEGDYYIELAKLFNLINDIRLYMLNNVLENIYFYAEE
ncbi:hypothetical protein QT738_22345 [Xanthomonas citri pv. citri]